MITLLASLTGFISSLIPEIMKYFVDKNDKKHELKILEYQSQIKKSANNNKLDEIIIVQNANEAQALYKTYKTGIYWVDSLNGTVRPVLAYAFFAIYSFIKFLQYQIIIEMMTMNELVNILWSVDDQAIFAGIISFYFGQRTVSKLRGR